MSRPQPSSPTGLLAQLTQLGVDLGDLLHPLAALSVFQFEDLLERPVEVIGDVGYLLVQLLEGVAAYSPRQLSSTSKTWLHSGHVAGTALLPFSLMRR